MWFKQIQIFQLASNFIYAQKHIENKLEALTFRACTPAMPYSFGWIAPIDEDEAPLLREMSGYIMICLQVEEKILPSTVVRQHLDAAIKERELSEDRKLGRAEKQRLKDEIVHTLLVRAFTKLSKIYGYLDTKNHRLILGTANPKSTERFISHFKKAFGDVVFALELEKVAPQLTEWVKQDDYPSSLGLSKSCVLQDPKQKNRIIRCNHQNLLAAPIQSLIQDGCYIVQLGLNWQDHVEFVLTEHLALLSLRYQDEIKAQSEEMEIETVAQQFDTDFLIMSQTLAGLIDLLCKQFEDKSPTPKSAKQTNAREESLELA